MSRYRHLARVSVALTLAVLAGTVSCGGGAAAPTQPPPALTAPQRVGGTPDQVLDEGRTLTFDAASYFLDPDGGALSYSAESSDERVVSPSVSGSTLTVVGEGPGIATVTATDPDDLSATQRFDVVASGDLEEDFESAASLDAWESTNADFVLAGGTLTLTRRLELPALRHWTVGARLGRTGEGSSPGVLALTGHSRFTAVRLMRWAPDDQDADRAPDADETSGRYAFAVFDADAGEWILARNLSAVSAAVPPESVGFTESCSATSVTTSWDTPETTLMSRSCSGSTTGAPPTRPAIGTESRRTTGTGSSSYTCIRTTSPAALRRSSANCPS